MAAPTEEKGRRILRRGGSQITDPPPQEMVLVRDRVLLVTKDRKKLSFGGCFHWNYSADFVPNVSGNLRLTLWPFLPAPLSSLGKALIPRGSPPALHCPGKVPRIIAVESCI